MAKAQVILCVLLSCLWPAVQADPHILSCSFTVEAWSIPTDSLPQCSVDGVPLHPIDNDNKRKKGNTPKKCADLFSKLKDIEEDSWRQLLTMELPEDATSSDRSLQVTVVSLYKEGQLIYGYWNFTFGGHFFGFNCFDSKNKKCALSPNNTRGVDKWQNNTNLVRHLETFIRGDSGRCFPEILPQIKEIAGSTSRTPDIGIVTFPSQLPSTMNTTRLPSTTQPPSKGGSSITEGVIPIVIIILIVLAVIICICLCICLCIYKCVKRKSPPQGGEMCCIFGNRRGQHTPSAVDEPHPEESISMALMSPLEGDSPHRSSASSS